MPRHQGIYNSMWAKCNICGFSYPVTMLQMQKGSLRDSKCVDDLDVEYRPKIIAEVLADTDETENEYQKVTEDPQTIVF